MDLPVDASLRFARPVVLCAIPVAAVVLWVLIAWRRTERGASSRSRAALYATRLVVVACLVTAAAGPTTVATATTGGDPQVTMIVDESASMGVYEPVADGLESGIESEGVTVERVTVADRNRSRIGEGVIANLRANGSVLVVSDGRVTGGPSLARAGDLAASMNATINRIALETNRTDARVEVVGPSKASLGVATTFGVRVAGVEDVPDGGVTVSVDGTEVDSRPIPADGRFTLSHSFTSVGPHRITASLDGDDAFAANDVHRKTIQVVEQPKVLYVSRGDYALEEYLRKLYDVERAKSIPEDLDDYYAVVIQDVAAPDLGHVGALQDHVIDGNGLVVVGGENAYDKGGYGDSRISSMLPVSVGGSTGKRSRIVLAVDISGSAKSGMRVQKALALDVLSQLGDDNEVGLVAFNEDAYRIVDPAPLKGSRAELKRKIRSLRSGGGTRISSGLLGASEMLGEGGGTVVLLSDGRSNPKSTFAAASRLSERDTRVISVGVGSVNERVLRGVAERTGGTYLRADETNRLRIVFGGPNRRFSGEHAVVVDDGHFITSGVEPTATLPAANEVGTKAGADRLVATSYGAPAISSWRFGLGRVVSVTAYGADGGLGDLRERPNSLLLSRSVNWAIGDPQRKATGIVAAPDTHVGEPTTIVYAGEDPPAVDGLSFAAVASGRYEAHTTPDERGYRNVLGSSYAVNYRAEYASLGPSPELTRAVDRTGGRSFDAAETAAIADAVTRQTTHRRRIERSWAWAFLLAALLVYVGEVCARRLRHHRGTGVIP